MSLTCINMQKFQNKKTAIITHVILSLYPKMKSSKSIVCYSHIAFLPYALVIFLATITISTSYGGNETDYQALLLFKSMISHDPFGALTSWNSSFHLCDWNGVSCGKRHRRVTVIQLDSQGLEGSLSPHLGKLSFLRDLSLWNNSLEGTIPHELGHLSRLRFLNLGNNKLVGSIPEDFSFLSKLILLVVENNNLTGGIPRFLGNITSLEGFSATGNPLGGIIPDNLGHLSSLLIFHCGGCNLYGTIPDSIFNLSLVNFTLPENQLTGSLPQAIGAMFPQYLVKLQLRDNLLSGHIPPWISNCSKLASLEMSTNNFRGELMIDFTKLVDIRLISLFSNNLYGRGKDYEMNFIDSLKNCSKLEVLDLGDCKFQGVLPTSIGNLSHELWFLFLAENQLYGNLPSTIGTLVGLETLQLGKNQFTGKIPSTIGMLQKLQLVSLFQNQFSGQIPNTIGNLSLLNYLELDNNKLDGNIPSSLGNCRNLLKLYLYDNKLSGNIPKQLLQLSSLSIELVLSHNNLCGSLPSEVGDLNMLSTLDLSDNNLSGSIPSSLGGCVSLSKLYLQGNLFQGMIPTSLSSLRGLEKLDLSRNNLSGPIPPFLEQFALQVMNLSYNDFEGKVPVLGVFSNASSFSIFGNNKLCGGLVELGLPKCKEAEKHKRRFPLFIIFILIFSTLFVISCFMYVWFKKKSKVQLCQPSTNERILRLSYSELLKATDGFSKTNLIGRGGFSSVYKGTLDQYDKPVAIKVLHLQNRGAHRSFVAECEAWRSIRHRNILKIITSCSGIDFQGNDFKALVYEFMPNGSLHDWLHSSASRSKLNILERINVLIDIANALDYLHNHSLTTIVHGDLKPSNILLDENMVAHVGDFGLTQFLRTESYPDSSLGIRGTIGYAPPEYGLGNEMTSSGDVYSYGILLLEVMTGKNPTDDMFNEDFSLHKFAYMALPDHVNDVIDEELLKFHQEDAIPMKSMLANAMKIEECLASTVKIGVSCSVDSPGQRMNIKNVINELQHILYTLQHI